MIHYRLPRGLVWGGLLMFMAGCGSAAADLTATVQVNQTQIARSTKTQAAKDNLRATANAAATLTARPTSTLTPTRTPPPSFTPRPTQTPLPTQTPNPTQMPAPTSTVTHSPQPAPSAASTAPAQTEIYGFVSGPTGYVSAIRCIRGNAECQADMPPGDISFRFRLGSETSTPWTLFSQYGLSVEKDGTNMTDMFMFVDAGWLGPGVVVEFGSSRNFTQPGHYVIRSAGCMTTDESQPCAWANIAGTKVMFTIQ